MSHMDWNQASMSQCSGLHSENPTVFVFFARRAVRLRRDLCQVDDVRGITVSTADRDEKAHQEKERAHYYRYQDEDSNH